MIQFPSLAGATVVTGGGTVPLGRPPGAASEDWVVLLKRDLAGGSAASPEPPPAR